jgi:hypothetical protein
MEEWKIIKTRKKTVNEVNNRQERKIKSEEGRRWSDFDSCFCFNER